MDNSIDIHEDSGRYLQEYITSLENLPSEIQYHWAEILHKYDQAKAPERRIKSGQHDLAKIHRQWFTQELEKREKLLKHQPALIQQIQNDYNKLENLADERVSLAEEALKLLDRHLVRLQQDLDKHDNEHPELAPESSIPSHSYTIPHDSNFVMARKYKEEDKEEEEEEDEEEAHNEEDEIRKDEKDTVYNEQVDTIHEPKTEIKRDQTLPAELSAAEQQKAESEYQAMIANRTQKRKKKEAEKGEPLYCFCQQVSYGEMVACDGQNCPYEWFHMDCVGLEEPPKGAWFCSDCSAELRKRKALSNNQPMHKKMKRKKESIA